MANETTSVTLNDLMPQIVAEALFVASERSVMRNLVRNYTIPAGQGKSIVVPRYPQVTAATLNEGQAPGNTAVSTDGVTLTVSEVGLTTIVSDIALLGASSNVVADVGRLFGEAIARKMDSDIMALFNTFTTNTVGSESTTATAALLARAAAQLRAQGYDTSSDCAYILHPMVAYDVKANLTNTFANPNAGFAQNEAMAAGYIGTLFGIPVYESSLVGLEQVVGGNAGDFCNALIHRDALGLAMMKDITIESQREAQMRGFSLTGSAVYAVGELYDAAGVRMIFDSSIA
jgi:N4-gp56 family major capsid protein